MRKMNVIYLNSHDTGRYIQPYGYQVATPHLQRLAEDGVLFRQCHSAAPTCSPSRASLMTGEYPHKNGMLGLAHRGHRLHNYAHTLANFLQAEGYQTASWGMSTNHCLRSTQSNEEQAAQMGYQHWLGHDLAQATNFIDQQDGPFFLSMSWGLTHRAERQGLPGFGVDPDDEQFDPRYTMPPETLPDCPAVRRDWAWFCAAAAELDRQMGAIINHVEAAGLAEQTLIIATTDHGVPFPGMKCSLTKHGTGVFLIMRGPGGFSGGQVIDHMVSHLDIWPTIAKQLHCALPDRLDGHDLSDCLGPDGRPIHDELIAEVSYHAAYEPKRSLRTDRWLYCRRFGQRRQPVLPNCDESASKDVWLAAGWTGQVEADEELYDLQFDPQERRNLATDPRYEHILAEYRERLHTWMCKTEDPLVHGPVILPDGGVTTVVDEATPPGPRLSKAGVAEAERITYR